MGETHSVTLTQNGPTGPERPGGDPIEVTTDTAGSVSIPTDPTEPTVAEAPEAPVDGAETTERPDWLPEKFASPEAMAEAYAALEGKMGIRFVLSATRIPPAFLVRSGFGVVFPK